LQGEFGISTYVRQHAFHQFWESGYFAGAEEGEGVGGDEGRPICFVGVKVVVQGLGDSVGRRSGVSFALCLYCSIDEAGEGF
jgi:hypothetical protein